MNLGIEPAAEMYLRTKQARERKRTEAIKKAIDIIHTAADDGRTYTYIYKDTYNNDDITIKAVKDFLSIYKYKIEEDPICLTIRWEEAP